MSKNYQELKTLIISDISLETKLDILQGLFNQLSGLNIYQALLILPRQVSTFIAISYLNHPKKLGKYLNINQQDIIKSHIIDDGLLFILSKGIKIEWKHFCKTQNKLRLYKLVYHSQQNLLIKLPPPYDNTSDQTQSQIKEKSNYIIYSSGKGLKKMTYAYMQGDDEYLQTFVFEYFKSQQTSTKIMDILLYQLGKEGLISSLTTLMISIRIFHLNLSQTQEFKQIINQCFLRALTIHTLFKSQYQFGIIILAYVLRNYDHLFNQSSQFKIYSKDFINILLSYLQISNQQNQLFKQTSDNLAIKILMVYFESTPPEIFHFLNFKDAKLQQVVQSKFKSNRSVSLVTLLTDYIILQEMDDVKAFLCLQSMRLHLFNLIKLGLIEEKLGKKQTRKTINSLLQIPSQSHTNEVYNFDSTSCHKLLLRSQSLIVDCLGMLGYQQCIEGDSEPKYELLSSQQQILDYLNRTIVKRIFALKPTLCWIEYILNQLSYMKDLKCPINGDYCNQQIDMISLEFNASAQQEDEQLLLYQFLRKLIISSFANDQSNQLILMVWLIAGFLDSELIFNFVAHLWYHYLKVCTQPTALVMDFQYFMKFITKTSQKNSKIVLYTYEALQSWNQSSKQASQKQMSQKQISQGNQSQQNQNFQVLEININKSQIALGYKILNQFKKYIYYLEQDFDTHQYVHKLLNNQLTVEEQGKLIVLQLELHEAYCKLDEHQRSFNIKQTLIKINFNPVLVEEHFYNLQEQEQRKQLKYFKIQQQMHQQEFPLNTSNLGFDLHKMKDMKVFVAAKDIKFSINIMNEILVLLSHEIHQYLQHKKQPNKFHKLIDTIQFVKLSLSIGLHNLKMNYQDNFPIFYAFQTLFLLESVIKLVIGFLQKNVPTDYSLDDSSSLYILIDEINSRSSTKDLQDKIYDQCTQYQQKVESYNIQTLEKNQIHIGLTYLTFLLIQIDKDFKQLNRTVLIAYAKFSYGAHDYEQASRVLDQIQDDPKINFLKAKIQFKRQLSAEAYMLLHDLIPSQQDAHKLPQFQEIMTQLHCQAFMKMLKYQFKSKFYLPKQIKQVIQQVQERFQLKSPFKEYLVSHKAKQTFYQLGAAVFEADSDYIPLLQIYIPRAIQSSNKNCIQLFQKLFKYWFVVLRSTDVSKFELEGVNESIRQLFQGLDVNKLILGVDQFVTSIEFMKIYDSPSSIISQAVSRLCLSFPDQMVWWIVPITFFDQNDQNRKKFYNQVMSFVQQQNKDVHQKLKQSERCMEALIEMSKQSTTDHQTKWIDARYQNEAEKFNKAGVQILYPSAENVYFKLPLKNEINYEPFPKKPIHVVKIDATVKIGPSKDRPKRVFAQCSDGMVRSMLLKYDHSKTPTDTRKEQRAAQLIHLLNWLMVQHGLHYKTFTNIAMSNCSQLIEWVDQSKTMKSVLVGIKEKNFNKKSLVPKCDFLEFNSQAPIINSYFFREFGGPLKWFKAKEAFMKSMVAWTAFQFLIAMGDRHCDNIMMLSETGEIFHIDYECILNKAKGLPVPEIVDFRLTKNFRHGLGPQLEQGKFKQTLIEVFECFRNNKDYIISCVESFVYDPLRCQVEVRNVIQFVVDRISIPDVEQYVEVLLNKNTSSDTLRLMFQGWQGYI